jgi:ligand-binding sensor domain-containing protein/serine phosphatase RsbU (regulator of sigma subunit)
MTTSHINLQENHKKLLTVILLLFCFYQNIAQSNVKFERYTVENGLSSNQVFKVYQDQKGFIWVATRDGLNRYDGYHFQNFKHNPQDPHSLQNNAVQYICEDKEGRIWIGTEIGLSYYENTTQQFNSIPINLKLPTLTTNVLNVGFIYEDSKGFLWIATNGEGLNLYDVKTNTFRNYFPNDNIPNSLPSKYIKSIIEDKEGTLWIANDNGICTLKTQDREKGVFYTFRVESGNPQALPSQYVKGLAIDEEGTIWIGSDGGVSKLTEPNKAKGIFQTFSHDAKNPTSLGNNYVKSVFMDSKGSLWVCADAGISRLTKENRNTGVFDNFPHSSADMTSISSNYAKNVFEDRNGQIWVATDGGINKFDPQRERFELYQYNPTYPSLPSNNIRSITQAKQGNTIWIGSESGLITWSNNKFSLTAHNPNKANSLVNNYINDILETKNGELWIATDGGVSVRQSNETFINFQHNDKNPQSICLNTINYMIEDKDETIWFATWNGIARLDKNNRKKGIFKNYSQETYSSTGNGQVQFALQDSEGLLWFATKCGLLQYVAAEDKFISYHHNSKDSTSLSSNELNTLCESADQKGLWIGTLGGGVNYFDKATKKFYHFTEEHGLASNFIMSILIDKEENLWISTAKGITKFMPPKDLFNKTDKGQFKNFTEKDGLQGNEFHKNASCITKEGKFFFGGTNGISAFIPEKVKDENHLLPVYITDFKLFNKSVKVGIGASALLKQSITETQELRLSYLDNFFSFDFTALNYRNTEKNLYAYKMDGFDKDWIYVTADKRFATYTNLSSGEYTFMVKAANSLGVWNEAGISLKIVIEPPIWERWWFRALAIALFLSAIMAMYRYRVKQIEERKIELEKQVKERTAEVVRQKEEISSQNHLLEEQKQEILVQNEELTQQQEEIMAQRDNIEAKNKALIFQKAEVEKSYQNITTLSEIGQKITSSLNMETMIATVYENVNSLMYASAFGIGIFDETKQVVSYSGFIERNEVLPYHEHAMTDEEDLTVFCVKNQAEILINDLAKEIYNYIPNFSKDLSVSYGDLPESLMYLPLLLDNKVTGVVTVQSFQKNAYNSNHIAILKTLASYIAIALDNARAYTEIAQTKEALAIQNTKVMDSIRYGETIQQAMLPHEKELKSNFADYFIIYKPKDVVSGDFYWFSKIKNVDKKFIAVVDCTGHGVPGAFMSMIGMSLLHEAINQQEMYSPAAVLDYIHHEIRSALKQDETTNRDGMDICLCKILIHDNKHHITFSGAKRPLYYTENEELKELRGTRKNIGGRNKEKDESFVEEFIILNSGEMLYLSTDGLADQSNLNRDKFGIITLKEYLQNTADKDGQTQKQTLVTALEKHQKNAEQRDDITLVGVRL